MALGLPSFGLGAGISPTDLQRVTITIDDKVFDHWTDVELEQHIDCYSTVNLTAPFDPSRKDFRDTFRPFSYKPLKVYIGNELQFTGTLMEVSPDADANASIVKVSAYSRPAVLHDCDPPESAFPLSFDGMVIVDICRKICEPFGFTASIKSDGSVEDVAFEAKKIRRGKRGGVIGGAGNKFSKLALNPSDNPQEFIVGLAKQRNVVATDDPKGNLLLWQSVDTGSPVARLEEGAQPAVSIKASLNTQDYFSEMTAWTAARKHKKGVNWTEKNAHLKGIVRPHSYKPDDTDTGNVPAATKARMARMFANVATWSVELPTWLDPQNALFARNTTIVVKAPGAMIYRDYEFLIRSVKKTQKKDETKSQLSLVLPGVFSGIQPETFPWDE
jgi:prophage tail gpP-like protein